MTNVEHGELPIGTEHDVVEARRVARRLAGEAGFGVTEVTRIVTAASELARNIVVYAGAGSMCWEHLREAGREGVRFVFEDHGPGIADVEQAMQPGFSTSRGLGLGLPGARRLMDEMEIRSRPGQGTRVSISKWRRT